ncbi:MAG: 2-hydroxyacid dehydrogenase [Nitrospiraceae bacterium]
MNVAVFSTKSYDKAFFEAANASHAHELVFLEPRLTRSTVSLARGFGAVCAFVNDELDAATLNALADGGTTILALRCAGYNNVDLAAARARGFRVVRVPAYSPFAVAEHTIALILALNRKVHRAYNRVREGNFALDGLLGFDLHGLTVGVVGTGTIGIQVARLLRGFGCEVLAYDPTPRADGETLGLRYVDLATLYAHSSIITLHCPLTPKTRHIIDTSAVAQMKPGVMLINTSRGALIETSAAIAGLKSGRIGYLGLDVYEEEGDLFFEDLSNVVLQDDIFARLLTFPNVLITGHQAFFTRQALEQIARTTLDSLTALEQGRPCSNQLAL